MTILICIGHANNFTTRFEHYSSRALHLQEKSIDGVVNPNELLASQEIF
jgi:hypothetical protein